MTKSRLNAKVNEISTYAIKGYTCWRVKAKATKLPIYMKELIPERINNAMALHLDFQKALSSTFYLSLSKSSEEEAGYTLECLSHKMTN